MVGFFVAAFLVAVFLFDEAFVIAAFLIVGFFACDLFRGDSPELGDFLPTLVDLAVLDFVCPGLLIWPGCR